MCLLRYPTNAFAKAVVVCAVGSEAEDGERALAAVTRREALAMAKVTEVWAADTIAIALSLSRSPTLALALALPPFLFLPPSRLRSVEARNVSV